MTFNCLGTTNNTWGVDGKNTHFWAEEGDLVFEADNPLDGQDTDHGIRAITVVTINSYCEIIEVDIIYNGYMNWEIGLYEEHDIQSTAIHEIGHSFGLHHTDFTGTPSPVMSWYRAPNMDRRTLTFDDKKGISFLYGGNLIDDETFSSNLFFDWDININSNKEAIFDAGSNVVFNNSSSLVVNGTLDVNGTSSNNVTFDFMSPSSNGIEVNNNATADISNAIVIDAAKGIYINEAYANINNTYFVDCDYGLYLYRTNYISNQPDITSCTVYKSSYDASGVGIYLKYSSPIILNTEIYNYYTGIGAIYNSSPLLGHYTANGNNNLHNNYKNLHAISNSNPFLGTSSYGGYNTLQYFTNYNIVAQTNCNIYAENNYWGTTSSSSIANSINALYGCSVDYEPFLYWNPNGNISFPSISSQMPSITSTTNDLSSVHDLIHRDKLNEAFTLCNSFISESKDTSKLLYAIDLLWQIERKMKLQKGKNNTDLFEDLRNNNQNKIVAGYSNLIAAIDENSDRIASLDNVQSNYGSLDIIEKGVLYSKFSYYLNEMDDRKKAENEYKFLKEKYPNAPITEEALFDLNSGKNVNGQNNPPKETDLNLAKSTTDNTLFNNYPNPFNPTTQISYQILNDGFVNLVVYNTLGQVVSTLVNEHQTSGKYSVQFVASNLPSGVYIYKIQTGNYSFVKKMLLTK